MFTNICFSARRRAATIFSITENMGAQPVLHLRQGIDVEVEGSSDECVSISIFNECSSMCATSPLVKS